MTRAAVHSRAADLDDEPLQADGDRRYLVIARYVLASALRSRLFVAFLLACLVPSLVLLVGIYLRYQVTALEQVGSAVDSVLDLDAWLVVAATKTSLVVSFLVVLVVGPGLVAPDLANNAMPLYLSRPVAKTDYVVGKLLVLTGLASAVSWVPGWILIGVNGYYAGDSWFGALRPAGALAAASLVWTLCLGMVALAISAWVKWRPAATLGLLGVYVVSAAAGGVLQTVFGGWSGSLLNLSDAIDSIAVGLAGTDRHPLPLAAAWGVIAGVTALAAAALFYRIRVR